LKDEYATENKFAQYCVTTVQKITTSPYHTYHTTDCRWWPTPHRPVLKFYQVFCLPREGYEDLPQSLLRNECTTNLGIIISYVYRMDVCLLFKSSAIDIFEFVDPFLLNLIIPLTLNFFFFLSISENRWFEVGVLIKK